jgi:hypothetical protein
VVLRPFFNYRKMTEEQLQPLKAEIETYEYAIKDKQARINLLNQGIKYDKDKLRLAKKYLESLTKEKE